MDLALNVNDPPTTSQMFLDKQPCALPTAQTSNMVQDNNTEQLVEWVATPSTYERWLVDFP